MPTKNKLTVEPQNIKFEQLENGGLLLSFGEEIEVEIPLQYRNGAGILNAMKSPTYEELRQESAEFFSKKNNLQAHLLDVSEQLTQAKQEQQAALEDVAAGKPRSLSKLNDKVNNLEGEYKALREALGAYERMESQFTQNDIAKSFKGAVKHFLEIDVEQMKAAVQTFGGIYEIVRKKAQATNGSLRELESLMHKENAIYRGNENRLIAPNIYF